MNLNFDISLKSGYKSASQVARVLSEDWVARNMYCPICGASTLQHEVANAAVKDFTCDKCNSQFELKSSKKNSDKFSSSVPSGEYGTMIKRITSLENPNFFFMHYYDDRVVSLIIVPKFFFVPGCVQPRKPLTKPAKRAGWQGSNIKLSEIPDYAKIYIVRNGVAVSKERVLEQYKMVYSLKVENIETRGWINDVLKSLERFGNTFTLPEIYSCVDELKVKHPRNNNIEAKIRQQLQILRDKGVVCFVSRGVYKKII